jgi:hypothetical protein
VPNATEVRIGVKAKSSTATRIVNIYKNGELAQTFTGLNKDNCAEYVDEAESEEPVTYKIASVTTGPGIVSYIKVKAQNASADIIPPPSLTPPEPEDPKVLPPPATITATTQLYINEVSGNGKWVEFYNAEAVDLDLSGYVLQKIDEEGGRANWTIPAGTTIAAGGFLSFTQNIGGAFTYGISAKKDVSFVLIDAATDTVDYFEIRSDLYSDGGNKSVGRETDGSSRLVVFLNDTKERTNRTLSNLATLQSLSASAGTLTPAFNAAVFSYSDTVPSAVGSIDITGLTADGAQADNIVDSALAFGNNAITLVVTAEDGITTKSYTVNVFRRYSIADAAVAAIADTVYQGIAIEPAVSVAYNALPLTQGTDYRVEYADNTNAGPATITIRGAGIYDSVQVVHFTIDKAAPTYVVPTNLSATYGDTLQSVALPSGWSWNSPDALVGNVGTQEHVATFTPDDVDNYNTVEKNISITVSPAPPTAVTTQRLSQLFVYPNPVVADVISIDGDFAGQVEIYSLTGALVLVSNKTTIKIGHLPAGTYIVKAGNRVGKVVKQ